MNQATLSAPTNGCHSMAVGAVAEEEEEATAQEAGEVEATTPTTGPPAPAGSETTWRGSSPQPAPCPPPDTVWARSGATTIRALEPCHREGFPHRAAWS